LTHQRGNCPGGKCPGESVQEVTVLHSITSTSVAGAQKVTSIQELNAQCPYGVIAVSDLLHLQRGHSPVPGADTVASDA